MLRSIAGDDGTLFGVASLDKECPKGKYRYAIGVKTIADHARDAGLPENLFSIHIKQSGWVIFSLAQAQYGEFWRDDPYKLVQELGWAFNTAVGLHIDAWPPSYAADDDSQEFMMPVKPPRPG